MCHCMMWEFSFCVGWGNSQWMLLVVWSVCIRIPGLRDIRMRKYHQQSWVNWIYLRNCHHHSHRQQGDWLRILIRVYRLVQVVRLQQMRRRGVRVGILDLYLLPLGVNAMIHRSICSELYLVGYRTMWLVGGVPGRLLLLRFGILLKRHYWIGLSSRRRWQLGLEIFQIVVGCRCIFRWQVASLWQWSPIRLEFQQHNCREGGDWRI